MAVEYYKHSGDDEMEEEEEEEDYIDMEVRSFTHFFSKNASAAAAAAAIASSSPQHGREFEFHMSAVNVERDSTTSPADELFYKGKLLPLHLPPRLQMVEKLLLDSPSNSHFKKFTDVYGTPLGTNTATTPTTSTPFESCNISPVDSCQVSRELRPEEYFAEYGDGKDEAKGFVFVSNHTKISWTKKLKSKIKSLFGKSGSSTDETAEGISAAKSKEVHFSSSKANEVSHLDKESKVSKKIPFGQIPTIVISWEIFGKESDAKEEIVCHRRSFSGAFKRRSSTTTKLSSSSTSSSGSSTSSSSSSLSSTSTAIALSNPNCLNELLLKRSSSANSEIETSLIQGAIAHCKQSQQTLRSRKTLSEIGCHSFPSKFVSFDDQASVTGICRG